MSAKASRQAKSKARNADLKGEGDAKKKVVPGPQTPKPLKIHESERRSLFRATKGVKTLFGCQAPPKKELEDAHTRMFTLLKSVETPLVDADLYIDDILVKKEKTIDVVFIHTPGDSVMRFAVGEYITVSCGWINDMWELLIINKFTKTTLKKRFDGKQEMLAFAARVL